MCRNTCRGIYWLLMGVVHVVLLISLTLQYTMLPTPTGILIDIMTPD